MYTFIKSVFKKIIPQRLLFKHEIFFRQFLIPFYKGQKFTCNICQKSWKKWIVLKNNDLLCAYCGSISRTRRLYEILLENNRLQGKMLHFSPSRSLYRLFIKNKNITYFATDFESQFLANYKFDITKIATENATFNTIICFHILEHISDDTSAILELKRVLARNGFCYIQTPFKDGDIYEDDFITSKEERKKQFGQEDHVRIYSINGLKSRLEKVGFTVEIKKYPQAIIPHGLLEDVILIAS